MQHFSHAPIFIHQLTITYANKECISYPFNAQVNYGDKCAIIGRNGSGKSSLMHMIANHTAYKDVIKLPEDICLSYIPQIINDLPNLSGGQRFNKKFSQALTNHPNLLLLDEPTNHLDRNNREALFAWIKRYTGTIIVITHDLELLNYMDYLWHINNGQVSIFNGSYANYKIQQEHEWSRLTATVKHVTRDKHRAHQQLMQEQERAKKRKAYGEKKYANDKIALRAHQRQGELTKNKNNVRIESNKHNAITALEQLYVPEVIIPKFNLPHNYTTPNKLLITVENGSCSYGNKLVLDDLNWQLNTQEKCAILGDNGSGKSTLLKAILNDSNITKTGSWLTPVLGDIGYLDQHYATIDANKTVVELIQALQPKWTVAEVRNHLNTFLLRKNEEVLIATKYLSGGEKIRANLAMIAAKPPKLLILDEISNNLELETKEHVSQILSSYPGGLLIVDHDHNFLMSLNLKTFYRIYNHQLLVE